jgi:hypothetical protein
LGCAAVTDNLIKFMFNAEASMTKPARDWMQSLGLEVKPEFITPWGKCDLVGASLRKKSIAHRIRLEQKQAVTSLTRAALLLRIPDVETGKSLRLTTLTKEFSSLIPADLVRHHTEQLIIQNFVRYSRGNQLQKLNGWFPLHKRIMAVELKLTRIDEVMSQARNNLHFAEESYVGLPRDVALRVLAKRARWAEFFDQGVGLLSDAASSCDILIRSHRGFHVDSLVQFCSTEKFWRNYSKGS